MRAVRIAPPPGKAGLPGRRRGSRTEWTVDMPGSRGARRMVAGRGGDFYCTDDQHPSLPRINR